jgi:hypothetical protein
MSNCLLFCWCQDGVEETIRVYESIANSPAFDVLSGRVSRRVGMVVLGDVKLFADIIFAVLFESRRKRMRNAIGVRRHIIIVGQRSPLKVVAKMGTAPGALNVKPIFQKPQTFR